MNTIVIILIDLAVFLPNSFNSFRNDESMLSYTKKGQVTKPILGS